MQIGWRNGVAAALALTIAAPLLSDEWEAAPPKPVKVEDPWLKAWIAVIDGLRIFSGGTWQKALIGGMEPQIKPRDLEAIVSASGKIQPKRLVNITAETVKWIPRGTPRAMAPASNRFVHRMQVIAFPVPRSRTTTTRASPDSAWYHDQVSAQ